MKTISSANNWVFQLANFFLLCSYGSHDVLFLRIVLMCAALCFIFWGSVSLDSVVVLDTALWNSIFCIINAYRITELAWQRRPIKFERNEHEEIFTNIFGPVGIGRLAFKLLIEQGLIRNLRNGTTLLEAGNEASNLTLIYSGSLSVLSDPEDGRLPEKVGSVNSMQFVESPQWANMQILRHKKVAERQINTKRNKISERQRSSLSAGKSAALSRSLDSKEFTGIEIVDDDNDDGSNDNYDDNGFGFIDEDIRAASIVKVTFRAVTDVTFVTWPIERLEDFLQKNPSLSSPFNAIIGADVAAKLFMHRRIEQGTDSSAFKSNRIYLPLDEPTVISGDDEKETYEEEEIKDNFDDNNINEATATDSSTMKECATTTAPTSKETNNTTSHRLEKTSHSTKVSSHDNHIISSPLQAEKTWLKNRSRIDAANDMDLTSIFQQRTSLNKNEILSLLSIGKWRNILRKGTILIRDGEPVIHLYWVLKGKFVVYKGDDGDVGDYSVVNKNVNNNHSSESNNNITKKKRLHMIMPNQMIGSIEFTESNREHIAGETISSFEAPCTFLVWDIDDLRVFLSSRSKLRSQLTALIATDLATKFRQVEEIV